MRTSATKRTIQPRRPEPYSARYRPVPMPTGSPISAASLKARIQTSAKAAINQDVSDIDVNNPKWDGVDNSTFEEWKVTLRLPDEITSIPRGSRVRVTLAATSTAQNVQNLVYLNAVADASTAQIKRVTLTLPVLRKPVSP